MAQDHLDEHAAKGSNGPRDAYDGGGAPLELHDGLLGVIAPDQGLVRSAASEDGGDHLVGRAVADAGQQEQHDVSAEEHREAALPHPFDGRAGDQRHAHEHRQGHPGPTDLVREPTPYRA